MLLLPHRHWPVSELPSSPVVAWFCCSCCSGWPLWGPGQWHDSTSWHTLPWSGLGPVADAGPRVWGSAPVPGGQPLFLCSPGGHCAHAMLAMLLGLRGCTAIWLIPAAAVAAAVLSRWVGWKQWEMGKGMRPKQGFARHAPTRHTPLTPHTPTSTPHNPHTRIANAATLAGELASRSSIVSSLTRTNFWMGSWWLLQCFRLMNRIPTMLMIKGRAFTW